MSHLHMSEEEYQRLQSRRTPTMAEMLSGKAIKPVVVLPKTPKAKKTRSHLEILMAAKLTAAGIPFREEYQAIPPRKFKLDFVIMPIDRKLGLECEGAVHRIQARWKAFHERHAMLTLAGWTMIYANREAIESGDAVEWVRGMMK